jgi:two-component system alkaline phosphatase synthesis response regulator PhoP
MVHTGQVLPTENLVEMVWGYTGDGNRELVRGLVQRLRTKVEPDPSEPRYIMTEANIGYYFNRFSVENASVSGPTPV